MKTSSNNHPTGEARRNKSDKSGRLNWGTGIAFAFLLYVFATLGVVWMAVSLDYHLVSDNYYESASRYQEQIDRMRNSSLHEKSLELVMNRDHPRLLVKLPAGEESEFKGGEIVFYRPSDSGLDFRMPLAIDAKGVQEIGLEGMAAGKWVIHLYWSARGNEYYQQETIFL